MLIQSQVLCYQYKVGDLGAWGIPTSANPQVYIKWSKYHQFKLGDSLLFLYPPSQNSVIQVTAQSYSSCNLKDPILSMNDGNPLIDKSVALCNHQPSLSTALPDASLLPRPADLFKPHILRTKK
ncbi:hypothetical protein ACFX1S_027032 [Malus domestica]